MPKWPSRSVTIKSPWRWERVPNVYASTLLELKTDHDDASWAKAEVQSASAPVEGRARAVFGSGIQIIENWVHSEGVELYFDMIHEDGWAYVNGQKVGGIVGLADNTGC